MTNAASPLLRVRGLRVHYPLRGLGTFLRSLGQGERPAVRAVDGVDFDVAAGETLGLVGESGCGKSTVARALLRLVKPTDGTIHYDDRDITALGEGQFRALRRDVQMVFQDPTASLNPRFSIRRMVEEPLRLHTQMSARERKERVREVLDEVGLGVELADRYPHELSGGQKQRANIARAIVTHPRLVILDEPTSALDVSLRARVILLLEALRERLSLSYLFISHDLSTVKYLTKRVAVMYLGTIVEIGDTSDIFARPLHPYTRALISAVPIPDPDAKHDRFIISGEIPSPIERISGCPLRSRCPLAQPVCATPVTLRELSPGRMVACHLAGSEV